MVVLIAMPCLLSGGTEMQTLYLSHALRQAKYTVVVCCYFEYQREMVQRFEAAGCKVECLSAYGCRPATTREVWQALWSGLRRVVRTYRPDMAHVQYVAPGALPILALRLLGVKRVIATVHTHADHFEKLGLIRHIQRHMTDLFTCVSTAAEASFFGSRQVYEANMTPARHGHYTIPNCLPPQWKAAPREPHSRSTIGYVGRLEHIKGADRIVPAFASVVRHNVPCRLLVVGDGRLRHDMEQAATRLGIADRVTWAGHVGAEKLAALYGQMDLVWVPSRSEGFGLTALEAMAQGCAVLAANTGGLPDVVGEAGRLFGDEEEMVNQTVQLLSDTSQLSLLQEAGRQRARLFSFEAYSERIGSLYQALLSAQK